MVLDKILIFRVFVSCLSRKGPALRNLNELGRKRNLSHFSCTSDILEFESVTQNGKLIWHLIVSKFSVFKIDWNCNFVGLLHHPFWLQLVLALFCHHFSAFYTCLAKDHWRGFSTRNAHMVNIVNLIRFRMVYTS